MQWERMTIDEFAICQCDDGARVVKTNGTWWIETRPFFFRPLFPFTEIHPKSEQYPLRSLIGVVQHVVPSEVKANSQINFFVYDDLQNYSLDKLSHNRRKIIRKGLKTFSFKKIDDVKEFIKDAYEIYVSFFNRTKYSYKKERLDRNYFASWAQTLFNYPKTMIVGAYHHDRLSAVHISYLVEEIIIEATFFSDTESQKLQITDYMTHKIREAAASSNAKYMYRGMPTGKKSLDESKIKRGCILLRKPAYLRVNPIPLIVMKVFMKDSYNRLKGKFATLV